MNQKTVDAMYEKLEELRSVIDAFILLHDTPEAEPAAEQVITYLEAAIAALPQD